MRIIDANTGEVVHDSYEYFPWKHFLKTDLNEESIKEVFGNTFFKPWEIDGSLTAENTDH